MQLFNQEALDFQKRVLERSGLGEQTYLPAGAAQLAFFAPTFQE
jgi:hypothetical protein